MLDHNFYLTVSQHFQNLPVQFRQPLALFLLHRSEDPTHRNLDTLQQLAWLFSGQLRPLDL